MIARGPLSRRHFLAGAAAACATPLFGLPGRALAAGGPEVAIVGAGISGLTAAARLQDGGIRATVYEAARRIGGRIYTERTFWGDGQYSEYGGELIDTDHTTMQALVKRYGLSLIDVLAVEPPGSEQTIVQHGRYVPEAGLFRAFRPLHAVLEAQVRAAGPTTTYAHSTSAGRQLDAMSLKAWIDRYVRGGSRSDLGTYLLLQYVAEYGIDADRQSALNLVYYVGRQQDYEPRTGAFNPLGLSDQRYHIAGGNDRLPHAMARSLPGPIHMQHRLDAIVRRPDGRVGLHFDTPAGARSVLVDNAIVTVPFSVLRGIDLSRAGFDARKRAAITELGYGDHSKLVVEFDERYWAKHGPWPGIATGDTTYDGPFMQTTDISRGEPGGRALLENFAPTRQSDAMGAAGPYGTSASDPLVADDARRFVRQLERVFPGATKRFTGRAVLSHYIADPFALGSYSGWLTGQYAKFAGYERVRQGNVHFAGEHCSVLLQGFMEGAAREGVRAAREVLAAHGIGRAA